MAEEIHGFNERLKDFMVKNKLSAREVGSMTGTNGNSISLILRGHNFSVDRLYKLKETYPTLDMNYLLFGEGGPEEDEANKPPLHLEVSRQSKALRQAVESEEELENDQLIAFCEAVEHLVVKYAILSEDMIALAKKIAPQDAAPPSDTPPPNE